MPASTGYKGVEHVDGPSRIGRYSVVRPLASGGTGAVFLCRDETAGRLVAVKWLRPDLKAGYVERLEAQTRRVAALSHPHLVTIHDIDRHAGRLYVAMDYLDGHSLAALVGHRVRLPWARRLQAVEDACDGLVHAHRAGLVHGDVKPANLMMTTSGRVTVIDFAAASGRSPHRTIAGTLNYLSPEQVAGRTVDQRSDVFAVGAVLYELLTGAQAFPGEPAEAARAILRGEPMALAAACPGLPPEAQQIVDRCLAPAPAQRYQDLAELRDDLGRLRDEGPDV